MDIKIKLNDDAVEAAFQRLIASGRDMTPVMRMIAGHLADGVEQAFEDQQSPDGGKWTGLSDKTTSRRKKLKHTPIEILQARGDLARSFVADSDRKSAQVNTGLIYAATHHFGDEKKRNIPARPFLGLSNETEKRIVDDVIQFINEAW